MIPTLNSTGNLRNTMQWKSNTANQRRKQISDEKFLILKQNELSISRRRLIEAPVRIRRHGVRPCTRGFFLERESGCNSFRERERETRQREM